MVRLDEKKGRQKMANSYYPFGLSFNSYQRVTAKENKYNTFQDQEKITDLDLNWIQFKWRNHDPTIGRFFNVDPLAEDYYYNSPYAFSENKVTSHVEIEGLEAFTIHGTNSDPSTFDKMSDDDVKSLYGNETVNRDFTWPEGTNDFNNDQDDRTEAAKSLADHVINNLGEGEEITLVGHSHGGNVAIQAVNMIQEKLDEMGDDRAINLVTIATPAYNGADDPENPDNTSVTRHTQFFSENDAVQTTLANAVGSKTAQRTYTNELTTNIRVQDTKNVQQRDVHNPGMIRTLTVPLYNPINSHFIHTRPELLKRNP